MSFYAAVFVLVAAGSALLIAGAVKVLERLQLVVPPSDRGLLRHSAVTGGGLVIVGLVAVLWPLLAELKTLHFVVLGCALLLACVSWLDDLKTVPALARLTLQVSVVGLCLYWLPSDRFVFTSELGLSLDRFIAALCWVWFINLYNFMDGIDGFAGVETVFVASGFILVQAMIPALDGAETVLALILGAAVLGFLWWNWHPCRIVLGDVGAVPIGFLLGWLLIQLAMQGHLAAAFILPLYFLMDATFTLMKRLIRGEAFWRPHREHLYQLAVSGKATQPQVVIGLAATNLVLLLAAYLSLASPIFAGVLALAAIGAYMVWLRRKRGK